MFQFKNWKNLYILALKVQTILRHSHPKEEKTKTKIFNKI